MTQLTLGGKNRNVEYSKISLLQQIFSFAMCFWITSAWCVTTLRKKVNTICPLHEVSVLVVNSCLIILKNAGFTNEQQKDPETITLPPLSHCPGLVFSALTVLMALWERGRECFNSVITSCVKAADVKYQFKGMCAENSNKLIGSRCVFLSPPLTFRLRIHAEWLVFMLKCPGSRGKTKSHSLCKDLFYISSDCKFEWCYNI